MYKKRFKKWKICKNTNREMKVALCAEMRRRGGRPTIIQKDGRLWNKEHTLTRAKLGNLDEVELAAEHVTALELPAGYACVTPPAESTNSTYADQDEQNSVACQNEDTGLAASDSVDTGYSHGGSFGTTEFDSLPSDDYNLTPLAALKAHTHSTIPRLTYHSQLRLAPLSGIFLASCYQSCTLWTSGQHEDAGHALGKASEVFALMVDDFDEQLLACVNKMSVYLCMQERLDDAVRILKAAHLTARLKLAEFHPIVLSIEVMLWQASKRKACAEIPLHMMRTMYRLYITGWSAQHPYTIGAGYKLAWRLALTATSVDDKREALKILNDIQADADLKLGCQDLQSVGILMTKARVLEDLGDAFRAKETMAEGIKRMEIRYPCLNPYLLEGQSRFADLLRATGQESLAEKYYIQVALGRTELLGGDHAFSKASIHDVWAFLDATTRESELQVFNNGLVQANQRWQKRGPIFPW